MSTPEYDIIFRGDIVFGHQLAEVKLKLQQLFKVDAAKVDALFTGRPVPLKRKLDEATANKYREVLIKAGAQVEVCVSAPSAPASAPSQQPPVARPRVNIDASSTNAPAPVAASSPSPAPLAPVWSIAPAGADLLPAAQRPAAPPPVAVDISGLSLRAQSGNLLDASEVAPPPIAQVTVPKLEVAELGATLADENHLPLAQLDIELDWEIAEAGADLLRAEERPLVVPVAVGPVDFGLAPAGSDLGQLKPKVQPLNPDISGLRLADPS
ncbi:hypothetical protein [Cellvibrio fontiphilus]|jgi:hypothetical protein|uniref:Ribosomal protein L7/L12 C-terminal domain-containing protein n=1 Tax=Cellvibrio fontiphilus TaxID=1815559 RepID=A0ABV7FHZ4_9GAMM